MLRLCNAARRCHLPRDVRGGAPVRLATRRPSQSLTRRFSISLRRPDMEPSPRNITLRFGTETVSRVVRPTPKANPEKLADVLSSLLSSPGITTDNPSFGSLAWELDERGDAIHKHVSLPSAAEATQARHMIMQKADQMNHHPHIAAGGDGRLLTITCTTHSPRGLSMRDTRLAKQIDEVLDAFDTFAPHAHADFEQTDFTAQRRKLVEQNRERINEALAGCGCGTK